MATNYTISLTADESKLLMDVLTDKLSELRMGP